MDEDTVLMAIGRLEGKMDGIGREDRGSQNLHIYLSDQLRIEQKDRG